MISISVQLHKLNNENDKGRLAVPLLHSVIVAPRCRAVTTSTLTKEEKDAQGVTAISYLNYNSLINPNTYKYIFMQKKLYTNYHNSNNTNTKQIK